MAKVVLINTKTRKPESFEPVDAREIMSDPDTIYRYETQKEKDKAADKSAAPNLDAGGGVPQLQGRDAELQTGSSLDKYDRQAVAAGVPGEPLGRQEGQDDAVPVAQQTAVVSAEDAAANRRAAAAAAAAAKK